MSEFDQLTLSNGIRVVHKQVPSTKIVHCGFILDIGSRDEKPGQEGIAHFWEHMAFKGTKKRKAFHIINSLESVGGELNAYTTKEKICFYASVLDNYFEKALELLTDITFGSVFPEKQIELEKNVILEEMASYFDSPEDAIQDELDELVFSDHPLGINILGTQESVRSIHRENFKTFIQENLNTERTIFSVVGNISAKKVKKLTEKHLASIESMHSNRERQAFGQFDPNRIEKKRGLMQAQYGLGIPAYSNSDARRLPFFMLVNILGGPGMNSRLNLALREKHGFVYSIEANYQAYTDTGLFSIFFGTEPKQLKRSINIIQREMKLLQDKKLGSVQLHRAKEQLIGQLAMAEENNSGLMLVMGKSLLDKGNIEGLDAVIKKIRNVTANELQELAAENLNIDQMSHLAFLPNGKSH